ncbi:hypothetical protein AVEN_76877-1 [Araneus ventricosus]|uniref:Uncharacterized protein n=1 Tax=Araneus ventricosus TaxID=182803 RepID=A0A4Y2Q4T4_ARAVE|nr:hypothetical protein AVEN_76877-1 [Araneus ventricosus]
MVMHKDNCDSLVVLFTLCKLDHRLYRAYAKITRLTVYHDVRPDECRRFMIESSKAHGFRNSWYFGRDGHLHVPRSVYKFGSGSKLVDVARYNC